MIKTYAKAQAALTTFKRDERGVTAIEYGLIGVAMAAMLALVLGDGGFLEELTTAFGDIKSDISSTKTSAGS